MPSQADITVKKADGSTDITYNALSPSAGNGVPAVWRANAAGAAPSQRPELRMTSSDVGGGTGRRTRKTYRYPWVVTDTNLGTSYVKDHVQISMEVLTPVGVPDTVTNEAVAQFANLNDSPLLVSSDQTGFAPT